ncbi:hypothetical protein IEQ34_014270 [Dendrobium chrysotoxum]|uniref:Myb-like domain-containing protein n=1 Tax=Dendrobium chrysotoxum TaxID=161865 RepID=A0AAV7GLJ8_DENCH|nr:hypothetical protein IEQ34_014270 [Dendrobium chrysotoxum]
MPEHAKMERRNHIYFFAGYAPEMLPETSPEIVLSWWSPLPPPSSIIWYQSPALAKDLPSISASSNFFLLPAVKKCNPVAKKDVVFFQQPTCGLLYLIQMIRTIRSSFLKAGVHFLAEAKRKLSDMGRAPCCDKANVKKGPWAPEEDNKLKDYIEKYGIGGNWIALPQKAG